MPRKKKIPANPFFVSGYNGKAYFCDRLSELKELRGHVVNGRNVVMYGWRRLGKTALIKCFFSKKKDVILVDLLSTQDMEDAVARIAFHIYKKYGNVRSSRLGRVKQLLSSLGANISFNPVTYLPEVSIGLNDKIEPLRSLDIIGQFLSESKRDVIIALDEFQQITAYKNKNAEAIFREWVQNYPNIRFVFSGSHRKMMEAMFTKATRPFYQSCQLMAIEPIPLDQYTPFMARHFASIGLKIEEGVPKLIYEWAQGQTYCIQLVCNYLFAEKKDIDEKQVMEMIVRILDQQDSVFGNYQRMLTRSQWKLMKAIAKEETVSHPTSADFLKKYNLGANSTVSRALKALMEKELVIVNDFDRFLIHDVLLCRWLQNWN